MKTIISMTSPTARPVLFTALVLIALSGCQAVKKPTPIESLSHEMLRGPEEYLLSPGDEIEVAFFHTPELNTTVVVRPDGKIGLPLAQGMQAAGKTPAQLAADLRQSYGSELIDPDIAVIVRTFTAYRVHVGGEVREPGVFPLTDGLRVLDAIFQAGGQLTRGKMKEVLVIRRTPFGGHVVIPVDLVEVMNGIDPSKNLALLPFDAIVVPPTSIANVNTWVDHYIRQNLPIDFGVGFRFHREAGDEVQAGESVCTIHHRAGRGLEEARERLSKTIQMVSDYQPQPLIIARM